MSPPGRKRVTQMTDSALLREVAQNQRDMRKELTDHVTTSNEHDLGVQMQLSDIREQMASADEVQEISDRVTEHKVKISGILSLFSLIITGLFAWVFHYVRNL